MTVAGERRKVWLRTHAPDSIRRAPERPLPVAFLAPREPAACESCGRRVLLRDATLCARCEHGLTHRSGCACPFDPARLAR